MNVNQLAQRLMSRLPGLSASECVMVVEITLYLNSHANDACAQFLRKLPEPQCRAMRKFALLADGTGLVTSAQLESLRHFGLVGMTKEEREAMARDTVEAMQIAYDEEGEQGDFDDALRYLRDDATDEELRAEHAKWSK